MLIPHRLGNCGTPEAELKFTQAGAEVTVAILADNPGNWPMHCHNTHHGEAAMFTTFDYLN